MSYTYKQIHDALEKGALRSRRYGTLDHTWTLLINDMSREREAMPYRRAIEHIGHLLLSGNGVSEKHANKYTDVWAMKPYERCGVENIAYTIGCKMDVRDRLDDTTNGHTHVMTRTNVLIRDEPLTDELMVLDMGLHVADAINRTQRRAKMLYDAIEDERTSS